MGFQVLIMGCRWDFIALYFGARSYRHQFANCCCFHFIFCLSELSSRPLWSISCLGRYKVSLFASITCKLIIEMVLTCIFLHHKELREYEPVVSESEKNLMAKLMYTQQHPNASASHLMMTDSVQDLQQGQYWTHWLVTQEAWEVSTACFMQRVHP